MKKIIWVDVGTHFAQEHSSIFGSNINFFFFVLKRFIGGVLLNRGRFVNFEELKIILKSRYGIRKQANKFFSIFVEANKVVTFKAYVRRDSTDITARIAARLDKNVIPINSDVVATCTAAADTWQELTLSITPVNSSELLIDFEAFGGNSHTAYIDDISVTQAV